MKFKFCIENQHKTHDWRCCLELIVLNIMATSSCRIDGVSVPCQSSKQ